MVKSDNDDDQRARGPQGQPGREGLLGDRLHARPSRSSPTWPTPKQLVLFDVYEKCADALQNGQVGVVTTDNVILLGFVAESDGDVQAGR